jgi:hypothetical protein
MIKVTIRRYGRWLARLLFLLLIIFGLNTATVLPNHAFPVQLERATQPYQFDFLNWETEAISNELGRQFYYLFFGSDPTNRQDVVRAFLEREQRIIELKQEIQDSSSSDKIAELENSLVDLQATQTNIIPQVEMILSRQVETILHEEGFVLGGQIFPPVTFRLMEPPTFLIISPRDRIERLQTLNLQPGLSDTHREEIENALNRQDNISSYVTDIGGMGSYPSMVIRHNYLPYLVDVIVHEWTHNYLFTFQTNMAWSYLGDARLHTVNETTSTLVGQELSRKVILRYYPEWADKLPPLDATGQPKPAKPSEFHLSMRHIRTTVNHLLADGEIDEAEEFMEIERLKLVKKGYNLRKLNQAYFAFHGSYALSPASVDPIGVNIKKLRVNSPSIKSFVDRIGWINSYEDYSDWLVEQKIDK